MFEGIRRLSSRLGATPRFAERSVDVANGGRILVLEGQPGLKPGAVAESLRAYAGGKMPFAAILLNLRRLHVTARSLYRTRRRLPLFLR